MFEIFWRFFILGLTSFGGPAAHIGYFRQVFIEKLNWMTPEHYARTIALSQFLPGPGSSQVGFAIGLHKAGLAGAISASIAFTLPSFILLYALAIGVNALQSVYWDGLIHGLKLLALVVVFDATMSMWKSFCKTKMAILITSITALLLILFPSFYTQLFILIAASLIGAVFIKPLENKNPTTLSINKDNQKKLAYSKTSIVWLSLTIALFLISLLPWKDSLISLFAQYYQAGSLVFGGGHVVLPLLQQTVADSLPPESFLTAYAAAQAVPGPMFSMATYLGAESLPQSPFLGALIATIAIFLPGFLLVLALHNQWHILAERPKFSAAITAVNASVVGFLIATLINPIAPSALLSWLDAVIALVGLIALQKLKLSVFWMILIFSGYGIVLKLLLN